MFDLSWGSREEYKNFLDKIEKIAEVSSIKHSTKMIVKPQIVLQITDRCPKIGRLKDGKEEVKLKMGKQFILTADRKFSTSGCKVAAYANCYDYLKQVKRHELIYIDDTIQLFVLKIMCSSFLCTVKKGGVLKSNEPVLFECCCINDHKISKEELDDIDFGLTNNIDLFYVPKARNVEYAESIRNVLDLKGKYVMLLAGATRDDISTEADAKCMSDLYCGIILSIENSNGSMEEEKQLIKSFHECKKPIIFNIDQSKEEPILLHPTVPISRYLHRYTDGFILRNWTISSIKTFQSIHNAKLNISNYRIEPQLLIQPIVELSDTETLLKDVAIKSYDLKFTAAFMISRSGSEITSFSRFAPICPIFAMVKNPFLASQLHFYRNVIPILYDDRVFEEETDGWIEKRNLILWNGIVKAETMKYINDKDEILVIIRSKRGLSSADVVQTVQFFANEMEDTLEQLDNLIEDD